MEKHTCGGCKIKDVCKHQAEYSKKLDEIEVFVEKKKLKIMNIKCFCEYFSLNKDYRR